MNFLIISTNINHISCVLYFCCIVISQIPLISAKIISFFSVSFSATSKANNFRHILLADKLFLHINKSLVLSPLTLRLPLLKLASIAQGEAKKDLFSALGIQNGGMINSSYEVLVEPLRLLNRIDFNMFNKIYVNYSDGFKSSFLAPTYGVQVDKVSFNYPGAATAYINKVIGQMTLKRLTDVLIKGDITTDTTMLLVNGAYLKATWEDPFDVHLTKYTKFIKYDGTTVMIPIMNKKEHMLFVHDDLNKVKVVSLKLASYGAYFTIVIPEDKRSFDDFLKNLRAPNFLKTVKKRMRQEYIHVAIPRFKIKTLVDWTESLKMFGLSTLFETNNAGLDGILKDNILKKHVHLSKVKQKNFIDVNEMGAFRVVTPAGFENFARAALINKIPPRLEAMADRPFYFEIGLQYDMSDFTKTEDLFAGIYCGPEA